MSYVAAPSSTSDAHLYGAYTNGQSASNDLWETFIDTLFPSGGEGPFNEALNSSGTWPPADLQTYQSYRIVEGIFTAALKDFFYVYLPSHSNPASTSATALEAAFANYLTDPNVSSSSKRQSTVLHWVWEVLVETLERFHEASPTKGGYALAMAAAEQASVDELTRISFGTQSSSSDYGTQRNNMEAQQDAEIFRSYRAVSGKRGQDAQAGMTTMRDNASQHSQMMSTLLQSMESMIQSVIKR